MNQPEEGDFFTSRPNNIYSDRIVIGILDFSTDHDHVHLREMRQRIYRDEQPDQASKDSCRFFIPIPVGYGAKSSTDQTTERGMRLPMDSARSSPTIPSREKTTFSSICRPTREEWARHHRPDQGKPSRGNCHLQLNPSQSSSRSSRQQRPTKRGAKLPPTRRFYLTILRPEPCIYSIGSPSAQKNISETVSKTDTALPCMR